ncbi:MAG: hypothetical protein QNJ94_13315 [Alphaproteobacteria bacterium]|nr:hypothetical protein [Alphaproteobacteria bacterium]
MSGSTEPVPGHSATTFPDPSGQRASIPVHAHLVAPIDGAMRGKIERLGRRLLAEEPALPDIQPFGPNVSTGQFDGPALLYEDQSEIPLAAVAEDSVLEYRPLLLAGSGDLVAIGGSRCLDFEWYCAEVLGLGAVEMLQPDSTDREWPGGRRRVAQRCIADERVFDRVCRAAADAGRLTLVPYMGTGGAWALAQAIAARTGAELGVAAPPPRLTRRVNDKLWFARVAESLLGPQALPPTFAAYGPAALAGRVAALAKRYQRIVVKLPDSAGSAGNVTLDAAAVRDQRPNGLRDRLLGLLRALGWRETYPLMVEVWDCPVVANPSVQVWIPHKAAAPPVVEGVFEQTVEGAEGEFVGALPSRLTQSWQMRLAEEATALATLFQELGYFGRCSFDAVLAGNSETSAQLHWIECNGRWGGVSIPMTLANRLTGDWAAHPFATVQRAGLRDLSLAFSEVVARLEDVLYRPGRPHGIVLLTPTEAPGGSAITLMAIAESVEAAQTAAMAAAQRLADT